MIGQMQFQKVFHNLDFLRCESINAMSAIVLLNHYVQSSPLLTRWDGSSIPANGIFLTENLKIENKDAQRVEND